MSDWPNTALPTLGTITPWSSESLGTAIQSAALTFTSDGIGVSANQAVFYPFTIYVATLATKMFLFNGASVTGNVDLGIYDDALQLVVSSGATAQAGTTALQEFDITDTWLSPGRYFMAYSNSSGSSQYFRLSPSDELAFQLPMYVMANAHPLPATATLTKNTSGTPPIVEMGILFNGTLL